MLPSRSPTAPTPVGPTVSPMPDHWMDVDKDTRFPKLKAALFFVGFGEASMEVLWESSYHGSPDFLSKREERRERISHINLVVSMKLC